MCMFFTCKDVDNYGQCPNKQKIIIIDYNIIINNLK